MFPKEKNVILSIYSNNVNEVRDYFYSQKCDHTLTINNNVGGYSLEKKQSIEIPLIE